MEQIVNSLNDLAWGPWMLILLVGTGVYLSARTGALQFRRFGYAMKNTVGKMLRKQKAGKGEVTPFQAVSTALAATVGTGNIAGVTGAIMIGGPGAAFWMWIAALFGMITKYAEVVLAVKYRERNDKGDWVGGPMYYIKNGMGKRWKWLGGLFCVLAALAAFGIGNMTQVNTIASAVNTAVNSFGGNTNTAVISAFGMHIPVSSLIVGVLCAIVVAVVLLGGVKRIGAVMEKMVPAMAAIYILAALAVVICHFNLIGDAFAMIFEGAFSPTAVTGGAAGIAIMTTIQKGVGRGVFSNEAGLGSAPMAHAATSETDPVKQGLYGVFEVFADTIVICTLTALVVLCGIASGVEANWGQGAGAEMISAAFSTVFGSQLAALIVALCIGLFALSTVLSWSLYGSRCVEYLMGTKSMRVYQAVFVVMVVFGAFMQLDMAWTIADTLNGFMAIPNLIAVLALSGVVIKLTKEHFAERDKIRRR